jgi:arsenite methyltransferase
MDSFGGSAQRAEYGIDAPGVVRNFALGGVAALMAGAALFRLLRARQPLTASILLGLAGLNGLLCLGTASLMIWSSKVGKFHARDRLLDELPWRGDEIVLDVGCGRGLLLVACAKRVLRGRVIGVDLWRTEDQSGNRPDLTWANARAKGVAERIELKDGDARDLPFPDDTFDVVVSSLTLHNIGDTAGRARAVSEIARVVKPGGRVRLLDFQHTDEYERELGARGMREVVRSGLSFWMYPPVRTVAATKPPESAEGQ